MPLLNENQFEVNIEYQVYDVTAAKSNSVCANIVTRQHCCKNDIITIIKQYNIIIIITSIIRGNLR